MWCPSAPRNNNMKIISINMLNDCDCSPVMGSNTLAIVMPIWRSAIRALNFTVEKSNTQTSPSVTPYVVSVAMSMPAWSAGGGDVTSG